ncbi:methylated-DNA--[protein]-cysteine S-methyltransferase [Desulfomonile tiedjei]|uniref:Methylated-DNA--protein-cysteine methyltransferase n=1 Tax=Desulfomonile tiedjei (strain ATCC 49306 / DSM 6799 / DCB-1) TaxID=706587 RepID=I4C737_DESTA|nr:methylated-DNA--[protein]-cysteine S-methyltransferase [Desulfomonile tiedjei]AFM25378.1 O-6-methylguanine DNA methyltransferase [Desulfomonile tiedjei DSM 6799]
MNSESSAEKARSAEIVIHHFFSDLVGWLELQASKDGVRSISFVEAPESLSAASDDPVISELLMQLDAYFAGELTEFSIPLAPPGGTLFQRRVWDRLMAIPYGETRSYGEIAVEVGVPKGARAVGLANKKNFLPIVIPCHRVIRSNGDLGGYDSGVAIKQKLLQFESRKNRH